MVGEREECRMVVFDIFPSGGFTAVAIVNILDEKLVNTTYAQWFSVDVSHKGTCVPKSYFPSTINI